MNHPHPEAQAAPSRPPTPGQSPATPASSRARNQLAAAHRRDELLEVIRREGSLAVADLAARANTSVETLRRDLRYLEKRGWVARDYGVVRAMQSGVFESSFARREQ